MITPPPPRLAEQAAAALENAGITPDSDVLQGITGVYRYTTGVYDDLFLPVTPQPTEPLRRVEWTNCPSLIPLTVEGINPPNLIRPKVEVEEVDSDEEDEDEDVESNNAP